MAIVRTLPFSQPRVGQIIYATFSGIFLSVGTDFMIDLADVPAWGPKQTSGALFILASLCISGLAWSAQSFLDHLMKLGKDHASAAESALQFESWSKRRVAWLLLVLAMALAIAAFALLFINPSV